MQQTFFKKSHIVNESKTSQKLQLALLVGCLVILQACSSTDGSGSKPSRKTASRPKITLPTRPPAYANNVQGNAIAQEALFYLGTPYKWGGNEQDGGLDCSGYTKLVFEKFGIALPRTAREQMNTGYAVDRSELQDGDLVFFNTSGSSVSHVGIYIGNNRMVHAPSKGKTVRVEPMTLPYWQQRYVGARRYGIDKISEIAMGNAN